MKKYKLKQPNFGKIIGHGKLPKSRTFGRTMVDFGTEVLVDKRSEKCIHRNGESLVVSESFINKQSDVFEEVNE